MEILDLGNNESLKQGIFPNSDGTWTAMTFSKSQTFKTHAGAQRWFKSNSGNDTEENEENEENEESSEAALIEDIKDELNKAGDRSGFPFDCYGLYSANRGRLKAMKKQFRIMLKDDSSRKVKRISGDTEYSIRIWLRFLADRYHIKA